MRLLLDACERVSGNNDMIPSDTSYYVVDARVNRPLRHYSLSHRGITRFFGADSSKATVHGLHLFASFIAVSVPDYYEK